MSERCPYLQGESPHRCLLAEHGEPLRNDAILDELERILGKGNHLSTAEIVTFIAGVRFAERMHGITG